MALLTLPDAKAQLNITTDTNDAELGAYIEALTDVIEGYVGPVLSREITETVDSRNSGLVLNQIPVISFTSLTPVLTGGPSFAAADVHVDKASGVVRQRNGCMFYGGPWEALYEAGRGETVPPTINLAARIMLQHLWSTQRSRGAVRAGGDDAAGAPAPGWGYAMPKRVLELLEPYRLPPVVA